MYAPSHDAAAALKKEYGAAAEGQGIPFLSTNDLITAAVAELADEGGMIWMFANMRGRMSGVTDDLAGNYMGTIHM